MDGLELDSEGDELYITSLLEFRDLMEGNEGISKESNVQLMTADTNPSFCVGNNKVAPEIDREPVSLNKRWYQEPKPINQRRSSVKIRDARCCNEIIKESRNHLLQEIKRSIKSKPCRRCK